MALVWDIETLNPLYPRKEVTSEYEKVGMEYEPSVHDRKYRWWYAQIRGRTTSAEIDAIYRRRVLKEGEFLLYHITWTGTDWKGNEEQFSTLLGRYEKPIFQMERNPQTQEVTSTQVRSHKTVHDVPFTNDKLEELLAIAAEHVKFYVYGPGNRRYGVQSVNDYRNGTVEDLITCADKGKSLDTVLAERNQFTYEKRETKEAQKSKKEKDQTV